ncbi:MAG: helix-turn-helix domain-containing protein [Negativicutes bacterium]
MLKTNETEKELDYIAIGNRLKNLRGKLSQTSFGEPIGYKYSYVKACEHGKKPSLEYLFKVSQHYNVSFDWLLTGSDIIVPMDTIENSAPQQKVEAIFDPDLKEMYDILQMLMLAGDADLRGWTKIQFKNAFKDYLAMLEEEKKLNA